MFKLSDWLLKRTAHVRSTKQRALAALAKQIGSVIVVVATFTLGYVVKNMEDHGYQRAMNDEMAKQRETLVAECNARIVQNDTLANQTLHERDARMSDQTTLIQTQTDLIKTLQMQVGNIEQRQVQSMKTRKTEMRVVTNAVTKAATEAKTAATVAVDVAKKGLTDTDRAQINSAIAKKGVKK